MFAKDNLTKTEGFPYENKKKNDYLSETSHPYSRKGEVDYATQT